MQKEAFDIAISRSYGYDSKEQATSPDWALVRDLYENNYMSQDNISYKIPKKIHQIWLGGRLPDKYKKLTSTWRLLHPEWEYHLWGDNAADDLEMANKGIFGACRNKGMKSDIMRYEILRQQGGLYVDTDFECVKPFDDLMYLDFFAGISYDGNMVLYNGLIATIPNHPIITRCNSNLTTKYTGDNAMDIINETGPYYFTRCFLAETHRDTKGTVAFPMGFFYPIPNNVQGHVDLSVYLCPYSYAAHHWEISWMKP